MANNRVYVENLNWGLSRKDLIEVVTNIGGASPQHTQIIRKGGAGETSWPSRKCSAIFTFASIDEAERVIYNLNMCNPGYLMHILAMGCNSLRAKFAYLEGTRSLCAAKAAAHATPRTPRPPSYPPPFQPPPPPPVPTTPTTAHEPEGSHGQNTADFVAD
jgi:hypothetical protein